MNVRHIATTAPAIPEIKTAEELIGYVARVSNPKNQTNTDTMPKLLKYCMENGHWSVFETAYLTVEITTSRAISAQLLRHRSFTFQEFSQRYAKAERFETYEARSQDPKNRQNSVDDLPDYTKRWFEWVQGYLQEEAQDIYQQALDQGIAKECARVLLPLGTQTTVYMTGNVRSWMTYLQTRLDPSTQKEHREIAEAVKEIFCKEFPIIGGLL